MPVAATFDFRAEDGTSLGDVARLDTMVTVVDARAFLRDYGSVDTLVAREEAAGEGDKRMLVDLLVEQVEFADVILLNKADLVTPEELGRLGAILATMNPRAQICTTAYGRVPLSEVLSTGLFDMAHAQQSAGWAQALSGGHIPESEEFGITNFVWRARRPVHPVRWKSLVESDLPGVIRAKGFFWLATRMAWVGSWQFAGSVGRHEAAGFWFSSVPQDRWPADPAWRESVLKLSDGEFGDRRQEIVFIGAGMEEAALRQRLEGCLLTDAEMKGGPAAWSTLADPFPSWGAAS